MWDSLHVMWDRDPHHMMWDWDHVSPFLSPHITWCGTGTHTSSDDGTQIMSCAIGIMLLLFSYPTSIAVGSYFVEIHSTKSLLFWIAPHHVMWEHVYSFHLTPLHVTWESICFVSLQLLCYRTNSCVLSLRKLWVQSTFIFSLVYITEQFRLLLFLRRLWVMHVGICKQFQLLATFPSLVRLCTRRKLARLGTNQVSVYLTRMTLLS